MLQKFSSFGAEFGAEFLKLRQFFGGVGKFTHLPQDRVNGQMLLVDTNAVIVPSPRYIEKWAYRSYITAATIFAWFFAFFP